MNKSALGALVVLGLLVGGLCGRVKIGTVEVDAGGLTRKDGERLSWNAFGEFSITPDTIAILAQGEKKPWWSHGLAALWNARLLLDLVAKLRLQGR